MCFACGLLLLVLVLGFVPVVVFVFCVIAKRRICSVVLDCDYGCLLLCFVGWVCGWVWVCSVLVFAYACFVCFLLLEYLCFIDVVCFLCWLFVVILWVV